MKLYNQYNTPMGVMRHQIAESEVNKCGTFVPEGRDTTGDTLYIDDREKVNTIADDPILEECDYKAFVVGLGVLLAIAVFSLARMLWF